MEVHLQPGMRRKRGKMSRSAIRWIGAVAAEQLRCRCDTATQAVKNLQVEQYKKPNLRHVKWGHSKYLIYLFELPKAFLGGHSYVEIATGNEIETKGPQRLVTKRLDRACFCLFFHVIIPLGDGSTFTVCSKPTKPATNSLG